MKFLRLALLLALILLVWLLLFCKKSALYPFPSLEETNTTKAGELFLNNGDFVVKEETYKADFGTLVVSENRENPDSQMLQSGWLIGEKYLSKNAALIDCRSGKGRILLFGFLPQFRAQTAATFKFFFNCLLG